MNAFDDDDWIVATYMPDEDDIRFESLTSIEKRLDPGLPLANPTESSWLIPPDPLRHHRSSKSLPQEIFDVVIIGSGFSGTSVAWHLLHDQDASPSHSKLKVLMLEARDVCSGATGRNGFASSTWLSDRLQADTCHVISIPASRLLRNNTMQPKRRYTRTLRNSISTP